MKPKLLNSYPLALEVIRLLILYRERVDNMHSKHLPCKISKEVLHRMKSKWEILSCRKRWQGRSLRMETETKRGNAYGMAQKRVAGCTGTVLKVETWPVRPETRFWAIRRRFHMQLDLFLIFFY